ncbi:MAG TPA: hypothetical protein VGJ62_09945 [Gemmatimonadaceae bacterium]|jgi:hypothetical protein
MRRTAVSLTIFVCFLAIAACADSTAPERHPAAKTAPSGASNTRYILASGDAPPPPGCTDLGNGYWECDFGPEASSTSQTAPTAPTDSTASDNSAY